MSSVCSKTSLHVRRDDLVDMHCGKGDLGVCLMKSTFICSQDQNETGVWKTTILLSEFESESAVVAKGKPLLSPLEEIEPLIDSTINTSQQEALINDILHDSVQTENIFLVSDISDPLLMLALVVPCILAILTLWYPLCVWWRNYNLRSAEDPTSPLSSLPLPPGEFGSPIVGETIDWLMQGSKYNSSRRKKYGNVFKCNIIGEATVRVSGYKYVQEVLKGEHENVTTIWPPNVRSILGENVLVNSTGSIHRYKRKITCKAFTRTALNNYIPRIRQQASKNIKAMSQCERPRVYDKMLKLTFDFAATSLIGFDLENEKFDNSVETFYELVSNIICIPLRIPGLGFSKAMNAREKLLDLLQDHIREKKEAIMDEINNEDGRDDDVENQVAIDIILREILRNSKIKDSEGTSSNNNVCRPTPCGGEPLCEAPISDLALKEIAMELMFAGYYTSASALTSCLLELALNPKVFKKVEEELLEHGILKEDDSSDDVEHRFDLNVQIIHKLTYLEQVLKETLRIRPPVLGGYRRAKKTFKLGDYRVPKGWRVVYNIRDTHEFEYEDMDNFNPDRFAPGNCADSPFLTFGGGARMCVGREYAKLIIKMSLIEMFRNYSKWELVKKGLPKMKAIPTLYPADGLPCNLYPREKVGIVSR